MIFPDSTLLNQKIPKERFYDKAEIEGSLKKRFQEEISSIHLKNKLSKDTLGIKGTKDVEEVFIFSIALKSEKYLEKIEDLLLLIDRAIPYPILYEIEFDSKIVYKIAYKERNKASANDSVVDVYFTKEIEKNDKKFEKVAKDVFNSINLEILYEKLIKLILNKQTNKPIKELVENYKRSLVLTKEIEALENKARNEKQHDKHFKLMNELGDKKKELERLE